MNIVSSETSANQTTLKEESKIISLETSEDEYPIIWYEPDIDSEEKNAMKALIQENSSIQLFSEFSKTLEFAQTLGAGFLLIVPIEVDEEKLLEGFGVLKDFHRRRYFDFEEETVLMSLFQELSEQRMKSLKVYLFCTREDFLTQVEVNEDEEEVKVMCDLKEMAKHFREEFTIFWCDPNPSPPERKEALIQQFDLDEKNVYTNFEDLLKKLENYNELPYHLILSGKTQGEVIINRIDDFKDLLGLYIYESPLIVSKEKEQKVKIEKTLEELISKITECIRTSSMLRNTFPAFTTQFDDWDKSCMNKMHYHLRGLINFKNRRQAKRDFINLAKKIYQSQELFRFEKEYDEFSKEKILKWYTIDSPIYKLINNCLRIATSDSINYCRYTLKDMERAIREEYQEESKSFNGVVYRGAYISKEEFEKLERNVGKEIEMHGFLSTSKSLKIASRFFTSDASNKALITIIIPSFPVPGLDEQGFADLGKISDFSKEEEILFNVRSKFQVLKVENIPLRMNYQNLQCRHLVLLYGAQLLRKFMTVESPKMSLKLKLPLEFQCNMCESKDNLLAYEGTAEETEIICQECIVTRDFARNHPILLPIEKKFDGEEFVHLEVKGKMLKFGNQAKLEYERSLQCNKCLKSEKTQLFKWINVGKEEISVECSDCFRAKKENRLDSVLILEEKAHIFWTKNQEEWEKAGFEFQIKEFEDLDYLNEVKIFQKTQEFQKCQEYCRESLQKLAKKTKREKEKLVSYGALASVHESLKESQKALEYDFKVLDILKFTYGEMHLKIAPSYHSLAKVYYNLKECQKALDYQLMALNIFKSGYEEKHPYIASSYNNLATIYQELGEKQKALEYNQKALDISIENFGEAHPNTATSYKNLALAHESFEDYQKALKYHLKASNIRKGIYGETHSETATAYVCLGVIYRSLGDDKKALESHLKALNIRKAIYGERHPDLANSYNSLALVYESSGDYQKALDFHLKALNIKESTIGKLHSDTATSYNNIALIYHKFGFYQTALEYSLKALEIEKYTFGETHEKTSTSYNNLATIYKSLGDYEKALEFQQRDLDIIRSISGETCLKAATAFNNLASIYQCKGEFQAAIQYYLKALNIFQLKYGEKHPKIAVSYNNIASLYQEIEDYQQTHEYQLKALDIFKSKYGATHPYTASAYFNLATTYYYLGNYQKALEYFLKNFEIDKATFGELHPNMVSLYDYLAEVYLKLGINQKVKEFRMKAKYIRKAIR